MADSSDPGLFPAAIASALDDPEELERRGRRALRYAIEHFSIEHLVDRFEDIFAALTKGGPEPPMRQRQAEISALGR